MFLESIKMSWENIINNKLRSFLTMLGIVIGIASVILLMSIGASAQHLILDQVQGDKVIAFKMKRRKGFRKKHGHRTHYTKIQVTAIA